MVKLRIVKNKYDYYKVQKLINLTSLFGIVFDKWIDTGYVGGEIGIYKSWNEASDVLNQLKDEFEKKDDSYEPI